jgi:hypothetical protein
MFQRRWVPEEVEPPLLGNSVVEEDPMTVPERVVDLAKWLRCRCARRPGGPVDQFGELTNADAQTLRMRSSQAAMDAVLNIEGFRALGSGIFETVVNKSESVKEMKKSKGESLTPKEKKQLTEEEKEYKSKRKQIQEKLIKFATRIPAFMYLTDFRENTLQDVITKLEPDLFKKVTGLSVDDFHLLVSLGVSTPCT